MTLNSIAKISYNGQGGFTYINEPNRVVFQRGNYQCLLRKSSITAVEFTVIRSVWFILTGIAFILPLAVAELTRYMYQLSIITYGPVNFKQIVYGLAVLGLLLILAYFYPNSKLVVHAGTFRCILDGPDEKLRQIAGSISPQ